MAVHGMRAQHQLLGDLAIGQTARDAAQDLPLTTGQQDRLRLVHGGRRCLRRQRLATSADNGVDVVVPREVRAALQRDERRARDRCRDRTPQPVGHRAVVAAMHDQRRPADKRKVVTDVEPIHQIQ
jgi:hypothetical protein